jgi:D-sedoheptulose 7-phosphate isomerase
LIAISASGNSPNIIAAARLAKELGGVTVGLVGFDGGKLAQICDYVIHVPTDKGEYGPVEDIHLILDHMITSYLRMKLGET